MGFWKHLTWVLTALWLACIPPFYWVEDPGWQNTWSGLGAICLGGCGLAMVCGGIKSGEIPLRVSRFWRAESAFIFWVVVVLLATISLAVLAAGFSILSGEPQ